jgi:NADH-quinone oxidoreductase subunit F
MTDRPIKSLDDLKKIKGQTRTFEQVPGNGVHVAVGMNTCGMASGAKETIAAFRQALDYYELKGHVFQTGCAGMCFHEPLVDIFLPDQPRITYKGLTCDGVFQVVEKHIIGKDIVKNWVLSQDTMGRSPVGGIPAHQDLPYNQRQRKIVLRNCGHIDPEDIRHYIAAGGYEALGNAVLHAQPEDIIGAVRNSGLRGRGGAGFPTGLKWHLAREAKGSPKYVVCNADEGDPGAFMDRSLLEGDPHSVLEGMLIAAYAIGSVQGFIYVRAEYPLAVKRIERAIAQAKDLGLIGTHIFGTPFSFDIDIKLGAGAFVCGEATALQASIEGKRGTPRTRPPQSVDRGLWGKPTSLNNVETFANIPSIMKKGADWYNAIGTEDSKGTKVFCVTGKVKYSGLIEVPMGISLKEIVFDIGGGILGNRAFKAIQTGGPSGGVLPESLLDLPVDYKELAHAGSIMGSGGIVVMDETTCMVDVARYFLNFTKTESCGQCTPCREGLERLYRILDRICTGQGEKNDIQKLEALSLTIKDSSLCGLGQSAPNPVLTVLEYFRKELEAHVVDKKCPAGVCPDLVVYTIDTERCSACGLCRKACPVDAISGAPKVPHTIDPERCVRCGSCFDICPPKFSAISRK